MFNGGSGSFGILTDVLKGIPNLWDLILRYFGEGPFSSELSFPSMNFLLSLNTFIIEYLNPVTPGVKKC